jgi:uncharacterized GH25 family protein
MKKEVSIRRSVMLVFALALAGSASLAHDMFLVVPDHQLAPHATTMVAIHNGTFEKSENSIDRDRMLDVSIVDGAGGVKHPPASRWKDEEARTLLELTTGGPGTYLVGVSTQPNMIELTAEEFGEYLHHDGILDVLEARKRDGISDRDARERYSKHVKTILQVGDSTTDSFRHRLGYPVEIVPLANPASLQAGDTLEIEVLAKGERLPNQLVYASYEGYHVHGEEGTHREAVETRTGEDGVARFELSHPGRWYVRLIHMVPVDEKDADYESNWATLTFQVASP